MDDLGHALASGGPDLKMLGGGQPARIPEMNAVWRRRLEEILEEIGGLERALTTYDPPRGNPAFPPSHRRALPRDLRLGPRPGKHRRHHRRTDRVLLSLQPARRRHARWQPPQDPAAARPGIHRLRRIRASVAGSSAPCTPLIEKTGPHEFKYRVDFDHLEVTPDIAAICASRPTNPTGNVLTDDEIARLSELAKQHGIPLIIDNAYGAPFPGIIFDEATPFWDESRHPHLQPFENRPARHPHRHRHRPAGNHPRARLDERHRRTLESEHRPADHRCRSSNPAKSCASAARWCGRSIEEKCRLARRPRMEAFGDDIDWSMHRSEGALFLWFWFPGLPITSQELYERLKKRGVLVIPGEYFFFGHDDQDWPHRHECIRVSYAMDEAVVRDGLRIIAEEVKACMAPTQGCPPGQLKWESRVLTAISLSRFIGTTSGVSWLLRLARGIRGEGRGCGGCWISRDQG